MNHSDIEAFLAVVKTGTITEASEYLHLSQSTISYRLKLLEEKLGVTLIERNNGIRTIKLTYKGEEFLRIAEKFNTLNNDAFMLKYQEVVLSLSLASVDSLNNFVFSPLYKSFSDHGPNVNLSVLTHKSDDIYELIDRRAIDIGLVIRKAHYKNIKVEPLFEEKMVLIMPQEGDNLIERIHPSNLDPRKELYLDWGPDHRLWHDYWIDPKILPHLNVDTPSLIKNFIIEPKSWSIVPVSVAKVFIKALNIRIIELIDPPPIRVCYKISHKYPRGTNCNGIDLFNSYLSSYIESIDTIINF